MMRRRTHVRLDEPMPDGRPRYETIDASIAICDAEVERLDDSEARDAAEAAARELVNEICSLDSVTPQQKLIIGARLALLGIRAEPSHHAVARMLGLRPSAVSTQWKRLTTRLQQARAAGDLPRINALFPAA